MVLWGVYLQAVLLADVLTIFLWIFNRPVVFPKNTNCPNTPKYRRQKSLNIMPAEGYSHTATDWPQVTGLGI